MSRRILLLASIVIAASCLTRAQRQDSQVDSAHVSTTRSEMCHLHHTESDVMSAVQSHDPTVTIDAVPGSHMDMGPHMKMTSTRDLKPGDEERADQVVRAARRVAEKYIDYRNALADGFQMFMPQVTQKIYHFTNYGYALEAAFRFNPDHPTSLLYEKHGDGYNLVGLMYTAAKDSTEDELNSRIPLSIAHWHAHVNLCLRPAGQREDGTARPRFGVSGSIANLEACAAAGGTFVPQMFGWMVHVYPYEHKPEDIWSIERQKHSD